MTTYRRRMDGQVQDLGDYIATGAYEGRSPHPLLDTAFYGRQRPDLAAALAAGMPALTHYRSFGSREGLNPHPLFDTQFYVEQCPEAIRSGMDPVTHYLSQGWRDGLDPHPLFSTTHYLACNPDVAGAGIVPILHFLSSGQWEDRETSPYFDRRAYVRQYPDVLGSGLSALMHYIEVGAAERRSAGRLGDFLEATRPGVARPFGLVDFIRGETDSYLAWVRVSRRLTAEWRQRWAANVSGFTFRPVVSVLCHVTVSGAPHVGVTLRCLQDQVYEAWQFCAVIDTACPREVLESLWAEAAGDPRITVIARGHSGEPAFALNSALDAAQGDFVTVLPAGDQLHVLGLAALVEPLQSGGTANLVYGDEDGVDGAGFHVNPVHKPDWSPDLLPGMDYLCRPSLLRTRLAREAGGFRAGLDGAADHDLLLRLLPQLTGAVHVRHPLYHRLIAAGPLALRAATAREDGLYRAVKDHARQRGFESTVARGRAPGHLRLAFEPKGEPLVSVVIPTADAVLAGPLGPESVIGNCIESLRRKTAWTALEIIVVHDGNIPAVRMAAMEKAGVKLVAYDRPVFNFSRKINLGVAASSGEYVLVLNDDIVAKRPTWLHRLMGWAQQDGVGVVGPKLFFPDGRLQHTGVVVQHGNPGHLYYRADGTDPGYLEMNDLPRNWLAVTGACQLVRRATYDAVGGYDEDLPLNFNDVDFCIRVIELGLRVVYEPHAELYHFEGVSKLVEIGNQLTTPYETHHFQARWRVRYPEDPYYHPDLPPYEPLGVRRPEEVRGTPSQARKLPAAKVAASWTKGVNWLGPMNRSSGMGTACRGYLAAAQAVGLGTRLVPLDRIFAHQSLVEFGLPSASQDFPVTMVQANADTTNPVFAEYGDELGRAKYRIGLWVWELPAAHDDWVTQARRYDEIWVPSTFNQTTLQPIMRKPVLMVPYALAGLPALGAAEKAATRAELGIAADAFVFFYMFDTFSFVDRKNPMALLDAFEAEFAGNDDVVLLLKISYMANLGTGYSATNLELQLRLEQIQARCRNVRLVLDMLPQEKVYELVNAADCYASPHRSEGFGLGVAEAMFYGKVVIATDFGGTTDFVQDGLGLKLKYSLVELTEDRGPYRRGDVWADPSIEHLRALMREVVGDAALCERLGRAASAHVMAHYAPEVVGRTIQRRLRAIAGEVG